MKELIMPNPIKGSESLKELIMPSRGSESLQEMMTRNAVRLVSPSLRLHPR